ncbi:MAG TPA: glycoside hydrolase [Thermoanaerobaculia bacterium]
MKICRRRKTKPGGLVALGAFLLLVSSSLVRAQSLDPQLLREMRWRLVGPHRGSRTVAVSGVAGQPNVFYMAPNNGGVWKSTDYGRTWDPIFDDQPTGSIGALAVAPSDPNVIYVGSGEGLQRPDLSVGDGIYKSTDGGRTWRHLGLSDGRQIPAILIDPKDVNRVFVAVLGHPYGPNSERGVFRSTDGGQTWQRVLSKDEDTGAMDICFDPSNSQHLYAVLWAARKGPWEYGNSYRGSGSGLFHSTDGGSTWKPLTRGLPTIAEGLGRIGITVAPSDPNRLYAVVQASAHAGGLFRSEDAGESWQKVNSESRVSGRADDFAEVKVDPANRDVVYVANTSTYRSTDGGRTFTAIKGAPGGDDYHRIWINPENPQILILGLDQGATVSVNGGKTWSSWYNQPTGQMFHVAADNGFPYRLYGGQQESGTAGVSSRGNDGAITFREFHPVGADEYAYVAPDPLHPGVIYGGKVTRYDEATGQVREVGPVALRTGQYRFDRTAPVVFSAADPHVLFFASQVLWKTTNGGESWDTISPDLTRPDPGVPANLSRMTKVNPSRAIPRGVIYSIGPSPKDVDLIWIGTDDGFVQVTRDGGRTWQNVTPPGLTAWSKVTQIDASHFDPDVAYISVSRFRLDDLKPYIYRTRDGGKTWQLITRGLPDNASVNVVREDPVRRGLLFAGTERQVWASVDDGDHWFSLRGNMPATSIRDLIVHGDDIAVATHGRSFWILDDVTPLRQTESAFTGTAHLFRPQVARRVRWNNYTDTPMPPEEPTGQNPPDGAIIDYWLKTKPSSPVVLEITDASGKTVRRFTSEDKPDRLDDKEIPIPTYWIRPPQILSAESGLHRFVWDLHLPPPAVLDREYPIAAIVHNTPLSPRGPWVLPGDYTVKLTSGSDSLSETLRVEMDPRITTSAADLARQFEIGSRICAGLQRDYDAIEQVRALRRKLKPLLEKPSGRASDAVSSLDRKLAVLESGPSEHEDSGPDVPQPESLERSNRLLGTLLEAVEGADAKPTAQAVAALEEVERSLESELARWQDIQSTDVPAISQKLRAAHQPDIGAER